MTEAQTKLIAAKGTFIVNGTAEITKDIVSITVLQDSIFASIKKDGVDVKADHIQNPAIAVKAGAIISPIQTGKFNGVNLTEELFTGVQLTSGSVALVLG